MATLISCVAPTSASHGLRFKDCRHGCAWRKGAALGHTAGLSQTCRQRGAPARLVKVAPEQIISTSNLNILKSKNNIESCRSYCKVLLHLKKKKKQSKTSRDHVNYLFACVKPRNLTHGSRCWNELGSHQEYVVKRKLVPPGGVWHLLGQLPYGLNYIPGMGCLIIEKTGL